MPALSTNRPGRTVEARPFELGASERAMHHHRGDAPPPWRPELELQASEAAANIPWCAARSPCHPSPDPLSPRPDSGGARRGVVVVGIRQEPASRDCSSAGRPCSPRWQPARSVRRHCAPRGTNVLHSPFEGDSSKHQQRQTPREEFRGPTDLEIR